MKRENGIALVTALCLLVLVTLLAASAVSLSQYAEMDSWTYASRTRSAYEAEGAANRIYWLILNDRKKNPQRKIETNEESQRFTATNLPRKLGEIIYRISDAVSGMDISGAAPHRDLPKLPERKAAANRLQDYVDTDDLVRLNGMEVKEYLAEELYHLPRNRPFQYREEAYWIPGVGGTGFRLIAPKGLSPLTGRPNLYGTPPDQIAARCNLSEQETAQLKEAFAAREQNGTLLKDSLPPGFLTRLEINYSTADSGFYTVTIETATPQQPGIRLSVTFKAESGTKPIRELYAFSLD